jgi:hypothetical protein
VIEVKESSSSSDSKSDVEGRLSWSIEARVVHQRLEEISEEAKTNTEFIGHFQGISPNEKEMKECEVYKSEEDLFLFWKMSTEIHLEILNDSSFDLLIEKGALWVEGTKDALASTSSSSSSSNTSIDNESDSVAEDEKFKRIPLDNYIVLYN